MKLSKRVIFALAFSPLFAQADGISTKFCGLTFNPGSHFGQQEQEGSGYRVRVNCNRDQKQSSTDPVAIIQNISPAYKGVITKFTQNAVKMAAEKGEANPRASAPYVCMDVTVDQDPCISGGAKKVSILSIQHMTVANIGKYLGALDQKADGQGDSKSAGAQE